MIRSVLALAGFFALTSCGIGGGSSGACVLMSCGAAAPSTITVFAASSLQPAFKRLGEDLQAKNNMHVTYNYAGTQTLTSQLTQGAQADVFASADIAHMKTLDDAGLVAGASQVFAHNRLEIAVERGNPKGIHRLADLARPGLVVVLADPSVPAGRYAQQALAKAHVTVKPASLEPQVTGVLNKVAFGEADAGIVYVSDIATSNKVAGIAIPDSQNVIADYPIAALKNALNKGSAADFIAFVLSPDGKTILKAAGFEPA